MSNDTFYNILAHYRGVAAIQSPLAAEMESALRDENKLPAIQMPANATPAERQVALTNYNRDLQAWRRRNAEIDQIKHRKTR